MKVVLIGFMGSGKSTVARLLAEALRVPIVEMDELILERSGRKSIPEIFAIDGESHFRQIESSVATELGDLKNAVISTGGGVVGAAENLSHLRQHGGHVVYLRTDFETIQGRIGGDTNRPLFREPERVRELYQSRKEKYEAASDLIVDTDFHTPQDVAKEICEHIHA